MDGKIWKNGKVFCEEMHVCQEICMDDEGRIYTDQNKKLQDLYGMLWRDGNEQLINEQWFWVILSYHGAQWYSL